MNPGVEREMPEQMVSWMRRRGKRDGYVASALEVCSGFSAAVPVRAAQLDDVRCPCGERH